MATREPSSLPVADKGIAGLVGRNGVREENGNIGVECKYGPGVHN